MKRTALYCLISGILGGFLALVLSHGPSIEPISAAQEPAGMGPVGGPAHGMPMPPSDPNTMPPAAAIAGSKNPLESSEYTTEERVNIWVYEQVNRSVVNITTKGFQGERFLLVEVPSEGEGSGVVLDRQGHILTNFHVVEGARQIQVALFDGNTYDARMIGQDPATDVAVLKIDAPPTSLFPVVFGNSTQLRVGQRVFAIGNPFGLERTLSTGIIASLNRSLPSRRSGRSLKSIIQIDAAINPGNSGGPLLDGHARMIGMNTAIASKTGESAGVGFAIPVSTIARIVPQLIHEGRVRRPEAGIVRVYQTDQGLLIATLAPGSPAERAGLRGPKVVRQQKRQGPFVYEYKTVDRSAADLIVSVDGKPVKTADDFLDAVESKRPGEQVTISVIRGGQQRQVPLVLEAGE
ncbi:MAG: trypsin-like peptidase domain-containing protein [Planctomycetota bacterium]